MKISHANNIREMNKQAIEEYGILEEFLMENASPAAYFILLIEFGIKIY